MKKITLILLLVKIITCNLIAQSPQKMSYQAVIRDNSNTLIKNSLIAMRISLLQGSSIGTAVYVETQKPISDSDGLITINIGDGVLVSGSFNSINWYNGPYFIKTEIDPAGGLNYSITGVSELLSVPYALYSNKCGKVQGTISVVDYGAYPSPDWEHAIDNTNAIQSAIDANPGKRILIPAGYYRILSAIVVRNQVELVGDGKSNTIIQPVNCHGFVITSSNVTIKDMFIYGYSTSNYIGIYCSGVYYTTLENLKIQNIVFGIELVNSWSTKIDKVDTQYNTQTPQVAQGIRLNGKCVNTHVSNCQIMAVDFGISIIKNGSDAEGLMITNTLVSNCKSGIYSEGILSLNVTNCIFDWNSGYAINVSNTRGMLFTNNWVAVYDVPIGEAIHMVSGFDNHITNNNIKCVSCSRAISILNSNNNTITDNTVEKTTTSGHHVYFDNNSYLNILKDNSLRYTNGGTPIIVNSGHSNKIYDNLNVDIK